MDAQIIRCLEMLRNYPKLNQYQFDQVFLEAIKRCYESNVYGSSVFMPIGSLKNKDNLRNKENNLE